MAIRLGFVPIARTTFDIPLATTVTGQVRSHLEQAGLSLVGPDGLVTDADQAVEVAQMMAGDPPDALLVFQATFADASMIMGLVQAVDAPLVLWAVPEARTGGRLRLNSLCGINMAAHSLTRAGHRYDYIYASPDDPAALDRLRPIVQAGRVRRLLRQARIGRIGEQPDGFDTCRMDRDALKRHLGLDVMQIELGTVFEEARAADPQVIEALAHDLGTHLEGLAQLDSSGVRGTLATYAALRDMVRHNGLDGLAMRCWPQIFTELGCAACGALSMLSDKLIPCSCETDVNGTVTQLILQWLSGEAAFGSDVVGFDTTENAAVFWHCGLAPLSMADPTVAPRATIHSNRQRPLLMEFPLKPGRVTIARLSEATGSYRLVVGAGDVLRAPVSFSGTTGLVRFDRPAAEVLDTIMSQGLEHHLSLTYGDHVAALIALAKMLDLPVLHL